MKTKIVSRIDDISTLLEIIKNRNEYKENSKNGLVILLNGEWGTGKTTFLEEFIEAISSNKDVELFNIYNAYENDYYENAYLPFFASIEDKIELGKEFTKFIKSVGKSSTNGLVVISYAVIKSIFKTKLKVDLDDIKNNLKDIQDEKNGEDYLKKYRDFSKYKETIKTRIRKICSEKPKIFIIDELDRCKPNFAMETLEIVKHFFDIENCIFIVSVDKMQLIESIKAIYGSNINSEKYFSKLFDYQYNLIPVDFYDSIDLSNGANRELVEYSTKIFNILNISLRDSKKIFNELLQKNKKWTVEQSLFMLFLLTLKYTDLSFYKAIINNEFIKYKRILESEYRSELEKYNKLLKLRIRGESSYGEILEEVEKYLNNIYSKIGVSPNSSFTPIGSTSKRIEDIEKDIIKYLPEFRPESTVKDTIIKTIK